MYRYIYIYIYICREKERQRERGREGGREGEIAPYYTAQTSDNYSVTSAIQLAKCCEKSDPVASSLRWCDTKTS